MNIGNKIKQLRQEYGLTQKELAKHLFISQSSIANYETNIRQMSYELLVCLAKYFDVTTDYILGLED